jgi:hypothetical protein
VSSCLGAGAGWLLACCLGRVLVCEQLSHLNSPGVAQYSWHVTQARRVFALMVMVTVCQCAR